MRPIRFALLLLFASLVVAAPEAADDLAAREAPTGSSQARQAGEPASRGRQQPKEQEQRKELQKVPRERQGPKDPGKPSSRGETEGQELPKGQPAPEQKSPDARPQPTGATRDAPENPLPDAFARFDLNGDGRLGPGERRAAQEELSPWSPAEDPAAGKSGTLGSAPRKAPGEAKSGAAAEGGRDPGADSRSRTQGAKAAVARARARGGSASIDPASRLQAVKEAVAEERARREARVAASEERLARKGAAREPKQSSLAIYRSLAKHQPKAPTSKAGGKGWAPTRRQGITRGKKRGSAYYREQISRSGRGRGRGGGRNNRNNRNNLNNQGFGY